MQTLGVAVSGQAADDGKLHARMNSCLWFAQEQPNEHFVCKSDFAVASPEASYPSGRREAGVAHAGIVDRLQSLALPERLAHRHNIL